MFIRRETTEEFSRIYDLVKIAFQTAKVTNGKEQDFVNQLRNSGNYIPELALVAEEDDKLIGHIMLTKTHITNDKSKFDFKAAINFGIRHAQNIPSENVMACELVPKALQGISGTMDC
jgi:predicted N-acetyltransferase YhbS